MLIRVYKAMDERTRGCTGAYMNAFTDVSTYNCFYLYGFVIYVLFFYSFF